MASNDETRSLLDQALRDPSRVFDGPEQVVADRCLSDAHKIQVLERWEADARLLQVATEENMGDDGEDASLLQRVRRAMAEIGAGSSESRSPTKLG